VNFRAFNRRFNATLEERRIAESEAERSTRAKANEDLSNWTLQRDVRLNAKKEKNRSEEQVLLESLESEVEGGNAWERVTKLIDLSADALDKKSSDVSRMRKLFIQLKNEPLEKSRGIGN
jgi:Tfp pilus assembly protein FimV